MYEPTTYRGMNLPTWRWADGEIYAFQKTCLYSNMKQIRGIDTFNKLVRTGRAHRLKPGDYFDQPTGNLWHCIR